MLEVPMQCKIQAPRGVMKNASEPYTRYAVMFVVFQSCNVPALSMWRARSHVSRPPECGFSSKKGCSRCD